MSNEVAVKSGVQEVQILSVISQAASDPNIDVAKMQALLEMQKDIMRIEAERRFNEDMNACQMAIPTVLKKSNNPHTKSKYVSYEDLDIAIRPTYTKHGFSLSFGSEASSAPELVKVTCVCSHRAGHSRKYELEGGVDSSGSQGKANKTDIQGRGSTISYLRRYLEGMIFNVVPAGEDNDGNGSERYISTSQEQVIISKLGGPGEKVSEFCKKYGLTTVGELAASDFDKAINIIERANKAQ